MTHTNHRRGSKESLMSDWVLLARTSREVPEQRENAPPRFRRLLEICTKHSPVCLMARDISEEGQHGITAWVPVRYYMGAGESLVEVTKAKKPMYAHAVFSRREDLEATLEEIKEANLGISVVASGLFDEVFGICERISTGPDTVNMSLGIMGKTDLLPEEEILEITTMCGHAMISEHLTEAMIEGVRQGKTAAEEAAIELARQCVCNVFNPARAAQLIKKYVSTR